MNRSVKGLKLPEPFCGVDGAVVVVVVVVVVRPSCEAIPLDRSLRFRLLN
jgi:hypothetical protein